MSQRDIHDDSGRVIDRELEEEEEEEDFLPSIPEALLHPPHNDVITPTKTDESLEVERKKRSRSPREHRDGGANYGASDDVYSDNGGDERSEEGFMELLNLEGFPSTSLYERSYCHGQLLQDIGVVQDDIGCLIATVDAAGTLRAWRKLPRGVFFLGDFQGLFSRNLAEGDANDMARHFILIDSITSSLLVVRIMPCVETKAGIVTVSVEVRRVNSTLMTVEARLSFIFSVTLSITAESSSWEDSVTPRPFLLRHDQQPFIVFFTVEKDGTSKSVFLPCVTEKALISGGMANLLTSAPISTANRVVCCQQHRSSGLVVLVDEKGIVDYARIMVSPSDDGQTVAFLQVISGVPARNAADPMMLRKWITFERRQKTGFFTLLREAMNISKTGRLMTPLHVGFCATGKYFVVSSGILRAGHVCVSVHVFEFASGKFLARGETEEKVAPALVGEKALQAAIRLMRGALYDVIMEDAVRKSPRGEAGGVWVFVPEILLGGKLFRGRVCGRRIFVFRAAPSPARKMMTADGGEASNRVTETPFHMEQMWRPIGDLEETVREMARPTSSFLSSGAGLDQHLAAPLAMIRITVPASQALKNLVAQSRVGSTLLQEDIKRLFFVPSNTALETAANERFFNASDPTFCTTSLEGTALLLYTKYETQLGECAAFQSLKGGATDATDAVGGRTEQTYREKVLYDLHQRRDFDCGDLLLVESSLRGVLPHEAVKADDEETKENDSVAHEKRDEHEIDGDLEEQRVQHIITAATGRAMEWESSVIHVSLFVDVFGTIIVRLLPHFAPKAVVNFVGLAQEGFYNGLTFHRVVPGFMIQGGCPVGDGSGGKSVFGERFEDEGMNAMDFFSYPSVYWLCMANCGPNTNESQFFITVGEVAPWLNGKHTVFGFVVSGKPVVRAIVQTARDDDDKPIAPVVIRRVVATERTTEK
ncbi:hypothetical protein ECC02_001096 [Trypanosoma cruzi]|uniref:peptidylprolyl isomerase n=1 Tax=Trypanosoma cruzi TaxID=5693 RepID=A0A7J6YHJ9_TRYCR|nr:hypothetical protein ECC02_001096 [Trypanosoma cruzi]